MVIQQLFACVLASKYMRKIAIGWYAILLDFCQLESHNIFHHLLVLNQREFSQTFTRHVLKL